ncbi:MAG: DUF2652 domain-containing protein [Longimicrobiales bacterium]
MSTRSPGQPEPQLLFIPDITGFSRFVHQTEIAHSQHIIEELLEALIDANEIGMTVSEIEGDAILFHRPGPPPNMADLLAQVRSMYIAFHSYLKRYRTQRICHCGACSSASALGLKLVIHQGEVATKRVKEHTKLFGAPVISVHRLLKNDVPDREYALFTEALTSDWGDREQWQDMAWSEAIDGVGSYDIGEIEYSYLPLAPLIAEVPEPEPHDFALPGAKTKLMEVDRIVEAPLALVFDVITDLSFRHEWQVGLTGSDQLNHKIAQPGSSHRCVIKDDASDPFWIAHDFETAKNHVTFTETEHQAGLSSVYSLRPVDADRTRVKVHAFSNAGLLKRLAFRLLLKRRILRGLGEGFTCLDDYCRGLVARGESHSSGVMLAPSHAEQPAGAPE